MNSDNEVVFSHTKNDHLKEFEDVSEITQGQDNKLLLKEQIREYRRMPNDTTIWDTLGFWNTHTEERLPLLSILDRLESYTVFLPLLLVMRGYLANWEIH